MTNLLKPYLIAIAVGLLVGIERENSLNNQKALGVRTFLLLSLLGALSGGIQNPLQSALITGFAFSLILISYCLQRFPVNEKNHLGLTTEFAAGAVYTAGYLSHTSPVLAATLGPLVAIVLFSKITLHRFTHSIKSTELKAAIMILLVAAIVIELTPDTALDPWGLFNPRKFGYLILALASLEFLSYIAFKFFGEKKSSLVVGMLGGLVSSTVVLISSAKQAKLPDASWRSLSITALAAQMASLVELLLIISLVSPVLFFQVSITAFPLIFFTGIILYLLNKKIVMQNSIVELKSPLDWKGVFRLSIIFSFVLAVISATEHWIGKEATLAISFLTGLFELQGISLANATLYVQNQVSLETAKKCITLAIGASLISKIVISWFLGRNKFTYCMTIVLASMLGIIVLVFFNL